MKLYLIYLNHKAIVSILLTYLIIFGTVSSYAEFTALDERTSTVRDAIVNAIPNINDASDVTKGHLASITDLNLRSKEINNLKSGDFSGLSGLTHLNLYGNQLNSLPNGIFLGLTALTTLRLGNNTVDPLPITVLLEKITDNQFKAVVPTGAPFSIVLPISVTHGSISDDASTITIEKGSIESLPLTVTRTANTTDSVTMDIGTLPNLPSNHYGYVLSKNDLLPLEVIVAVATENIGITTVVPDEQIVPVPIMSKINGNSAPIFADGTITLRTVAENSAADVNIGAAVVATDPNNDEITYILSGTNADSFNIDSTTGQLQTKAALDYETKRVYSVTITASDGILTDTITVIIGIVNVNDIRTDSVIVPVNERTPHVRDVIVQVLPNVDYPADVTTSQLTTITQLNLRNTGISKLKTGDFSGLSELTRLNLNGNLLSSLPEGIFKGLTSLTTLRLGGNLTDPMPLIVSLQQVATNEYRVVIPAGAPFHVVVPIDGAGNTTMVTIPKGSVNSTSFTVMNAAIVDIGILPSVPTNHYGYVLSRSTVCNRTHQVIEAITAVVSGVTDCWNISEIHLATITNLDLNNKKIRLLNSADFAGMLSLRSLNLQNNQLSSLPVGIFEGLTSLNQLNLSGNSVAPLPLTIALEKVGENQIRAVVQTGAPFDIVLQISVKNGFLDADNITIPKGSMYSIPLTLLRSQNTIEEVTVDFAALPNLPSMHSGYTLVKPQGYPLEIHGRINVAPVYTDAATTRTIAENTPSGENIGEAITATDDNNDSLTYTLTGTDASSFDIDSKTGQLKTKSALDYEAKTSYSVTITVSDGTLTDMISVTINVNDLDENRAPVFMDGDSTTREVTENTEARENIGKPVVATDADDDDVLTYMISGSDATSFSIDSSSGQLRTSSTLDYETKTSYAVTVTVSDGTFIDTITVTINVTDIDELQATTEDTVIIPETDNTLTNSAPEFSDGDSTTRKVSENTESGENIGIPVAATDADNNTLTYSLGGTDASVFSIDTKSGQLKTRAALDYERNNSYFVTITVTDGNLTDTIAVTINITDVAETPVTKEEAATAKTETDLKQTDPTTEGDATKTETTVTNNAPKFTDGDSTTRTVPENIGLGEDIGTPVSATDEEDDVLTYMIGGSDATSFSIDSSSGQLRTSSTLDYETKTSYAVTVTVSDGTFTDTITVTINVINIDELQATTEDTVIIPLTDNTLTNNAPEFTDGHSATRSVDENIGSGVDIGSTVSATDPDRDTLTYGLSGTDASSFSIDSTTGQLRTSAALDYETKSSYSVTITVSDSNGDSDSISVTINVTDVNEAPVFSDGASTTRETAENAPVNSNIGSAVSATDPDLNNLTYTLSGSDASSFSIDNATGQLKTKASLDYEKNPTYSVTIIVTDGNLTDTITVTINVSNLDETPSNNSPIFTEGSSTTRSVVENTAKDKNIGTPIAATDVDNDLLTYLLSGTDAAAFSIDRKTGQLKTDAALNHEDKSSYSVTATVSDGSKTDTIRITISVTDVNEAPIIAPNTLTTLFIAENTETGTNIGGILSATDPDEGDTLTYTLGGPDAASFSIVTTSGQLQTKAVLDYETKKSFSITITVSDGALEDTIDMIINVTNVDENRAPKFSEGDVTTRSIAENASSGVEIGAAVSATDADDDDLTYRLSGTDETSFEINSSNGQLLTKSPLDFEKKNSYSVKIAVFDNNGGEDSIKVTINVTDIDENRAPVFTEGDSTTREVAENTSPGQNIGEPIAATDSDKDILIYTLGGTDASSFRIVRNTGQLQTSAALDFETQNSYSIRISVTDGNSGSDSIAVTISVTDMIEITPVSERTAYIRDAIVAAAGVDSADDVTPEHLAQITDLSLYNKKMNTLKVGDFSGMSGLRNLSLYYTGLKSLPAGVFAENTELRSIELGACYFKMLPAGVFDNNTKLTNLSFGGGGLTWLRSDVFSNLTELTRINLYSNDLTSLPAGVFDNNTKLRELTLNKNKLKSLRPGVFDNNTKLCDLYLYSNDLTSLPTGVFDNNTKLLQLFLDDNGLTALPANVFDNNTELKWLYLNNNKLTSLPSNVFDNNTELRRLTLHDNELTSLSTGVFNNNTKLTLLDFSNNQVSSLPAEVFDNNTALIELFFARNRLTVLPANVFDNNTNLTKLILNGNSLTDLPANVFDNNTNLTDLFIFRNKLTSLPANVFDNNRQLEYLYMSSNNLSSLPANVFDNNTVLIELSLNRNQIRDVSELEGLTSLNSLYLSGNPISDYGPLRSLKTSKPQITIDINLNNNIPIFADGDSATRSVYEKTTAGENIGEPFSATDSDTSDTLTYTLSGTDASSFSLVSTNGQLQTKTELDYESKTSYLVTITVYDGNSGGDSISVTINVTKLEGAAPSVQPTPANPNTTALLQNYPNPFNPETWIPYQLSKPAEVTLSIYNVRGIVVRQIALGNKATGIYSNRRRAAYWDGKNAFGEQVAAGIYICNFTAGDFTATRKMLILK